MINHVLAYDFISCFITLCFIFLVFLFVIDSVLFGRLCNDFLIIYDFHNTLFYLHLHDICVFVDSKGGENRYRYVLDMLLGREEKYIYMRAIDMYFIVKRGEMC